MMENARLDNLKIGILGCGHLGQALASALVNAGFHKENLVISYGGNPATYQKLKHMGLEKRLRVNTELTKFSDIVFICLKPSEALHLKGLDFLDCTLVLSFMAGINLRMLREILHREAHRVMTSGPDTIEAGKGIAAMVPVCELLTDLFHAMHIKTLPLQGEEDLNVFTAGVCLPAALLRMDDRVLQKEAIGRIATDFPLFTSLFDWAEGVLPNFQSSLEKEEYIRRMITKGGVTEAIIDSLYDGAALDIALRKGMERIASIASKAVPSITDSYRM